MKCFVALLAALALFVNGANLVFANEPNKDEFTKAVTESLKKEHYDFKNNSLSISHMESFNVNDPDGKISKVWAAVGEYKTVRDNIFYFTHQDVIYYDATNQEVLTGIKAANFEKLVKYKSQYEGELGKEMHLGAVLLLLSLFLIVPAFFMFVWGKQIYSTTRFKVPNNLYNEHETFN